MRVVKLIVIAVVLAVPVIAIVFHAIAGPEQLHRTLAAIEARTLTSAPSLLRVIATDATDDERAVWKAILADLPVQVAVDPLTSFNGEDAPALFDRIAHEDAAAAPAVHEFLVRNAQRATIPHERRVNGDDRPRLSLSRVGFTPDGTRAIVYVELTDCPLCGFGQYLILRVDNGHWRSIGHVTNWVS